MQALCITTVNAEKLVVFLNNEKHNFYSLPFTEEVLNSLQSGWFFIFSSKLIYFTNTTSTSQFGQCYCGLKYLVAFSIDKSSIHIFEIYAHY